MLGQTSPTSLLPYRCLSYYTVGVNSSKHPNQLGQRKHEAVSQ